MKVCFLMFSMFPEWLIFRYLKYPSNRAFLGEGVAIRNLPSTYEFERFLVHAILCQITGKKVLEKIVLLLKKSLIFSPKILYEPCKLTGDVKQRSQHYRT